MSRIMTKVLVGLIVLSGTAMAGQTDQERGALVKAAWGKGNYDEGRSLCKKATLLPRIDMSFDDIYATTWCGPWDRPRVTTTARGTTVSQTHCLHLVNHSCQRQGRLYFENGVLTMISED
jgi:hypothetical protein